MLKTLWPEKAYVWGTEGSVWLEGKAWRRGWGRVEEALGSQQWLKARQEYYLILGRRLITCGKWIGAE